jgi:hypothetical protein
VTSRILGNNGATNASEALLLIDEPGVAALPAPVPGFGPAAPQTLCTTPAVGAGAGGCSVFASDRTVNGGTIQVAVNSAGTVGANVYQGLVSANQVTFQGIPILAPVSAGVQRIFRITNVRANVNALFSGGLSGVNSVLASISISGSTSLPVNNPVQIAGFVQPGLSVVFRNFNNSGGLAGAGQAFPQCNTLNSPSGVAVLQYNENFGTAFKTRVAPTAAYNGQSGSPVSQNIPGTIYNSESGFYFPVSGSAIPAGLADYGTRLKATFNNVSPGVRIFVSVTNLASNITSANTAAPSGNTNTSSYAVLINGEASPDANGFPPVLAPTTSLNSSTTGVYDITNGGAVAGQAYTAVWEVINTNPSTNETFNFAVWTQFTANANNNSPLPGTANVNASYAPTPTVPFSVSAGQSASSSLTIPRFADTSGTGRAVLVINICQTLLLFPFVTNQSGFDTGIAISNTSADPVGTAAQNGRCTLSFYDGTGKTPNTSAAPFDNVASGTVATSLASTVAPGFTGYMMALCNFQYAHGFAFISDIGARNLAMGYLALVVNNGTVSRSNAPSAESLGH